MPNLTHIGYHRNVGVCNSRGAETPLSASSRETLGALLTSSNRAGAHRVTTELHPELPIYEKHCITHVDALPFLTRNWPGYLPAAPSISGAAGPANQAGFSHFNDGHRFGLAAQGWIPEGSPFRGMRDAMSGEEFSDKQDLMATSLTFDFDPGARQLSLLTLLKPSYNFRNVVADGTYEAQGPVFSVIKDYAGPDLWTVFFYGGTKCTSYWQEIEKWLVHNWQWLTSRNLTEEDALNVVLQNKVCSSGVEDSLEDCYSTALNGNGLRSDVVLAEILERFPYKDVWPESMRAQDDPLSPDRDSDDEYDSDDP